MTEVNEELVRRYFELQGYFVRMNVPYSYRTPKGMGWSDVDLCISHPKSRDAAAVEVKGWHTESISPGHIRNWPSLFNFVRSEALDAVSDLFGHSEFRRARREPTWGAWPRGSDASGHRSRGRDLGVS